ncbi:NUDIX domain-containing protein [Actinoplanes sp. NPDC049265]|uniref:NUDIX hydrolase n=1 Tax=Actinoplanes sp. NPDC049265 TaxID=3363902 RepID=UPI00371B159A
MTEPRDGYPLPPAMVKRAHEFTGPPAPTRPAATVVLLREAGPGFEAYVLRRARGMAFGGVYAFPGGGVDPDDQPVTVRSDWAERLGVSDAEARAVVGAAVRELFEEAGVLLAGRGDAGARAAGEQEADEDEAVALAGREEAAAGVAGYDVVADVVGDEWEADRVAVMRRELRMADLLARRGLRMRDDLLHPWGRWVTPEFEPRRFDTWFFVAALPAGQEARDVSGESDGTAWVDPAETGELTMLPPTRVTLASLEAFASIEQVLVEKRNAAVPVRPRVELTGDGGAVLRVDQ